MAGTTQVSALAAALHLDPRTTTEALRRSQVALDAPGVTAAATRALRAGLRIPRRWAVGDVSLAAERTGRPTSSGGGSALEPRIPA